MEQSELTEMKNGIGVKLDILIAKAQQQRDEAFAIFTRLDSKFAELQRLRDEEFALFERIEKTFFEGEILQPKPSIPTEAQTVTAQPACANGLSYAARVKMALDRQTGEFTSQQLWYAASHDSNGPQIPGGTFRSILSKLVATGKIVVIKKATGNTPGVYRRAQ